MFSPRHVSARTNGGARDKLALEEIVLLSGANNKQLIPRLALPFCRKSKPILINRRRSRKHCWEIGKAGFIGRTQLLLLSFYIFIGVASMNTLKH